MVNALTRHTGITLGPIVLETLVKHYFERVAKENENEETTRLRKEELLYDEAFNIIKVSFFPGCGFGRSCVRGARWLRAHDAGSRVWSRHAEGLLCASEVRLVWTAACACLVVVRLGLLSIRSLCTFCRQHFVGGGTKSRS